MRGSHTNPEAAAITDGGGGERGGRNFRRRRNYFRRADYDAASIDFSAAGRHRLPDPVPLPRPCPRPACESEPNELGRIYFWATTSP